MREILFRGKRIDNGEWVEGFYSERKDTQGQIVEAVIIEDAYEQVTGGQRYIRSDLNHDCYRVDPVTVGQYTGLQDKNGKPIFEWDIIHTSRDGGRTYVVIYDDDLCAFVGRVYESNIFVTFEGDGDWYEVIGNIHDNPELMEA